MTEKNKKKIVIVGSGISGLTAGAYILRSGQELLILEKTSKWGGLVSSFKRNGFLFDTGPRAIGNGGILVPMLEDLNIDLALTQGEVSTGLRDRIVHYYSHKDIDHFILSLLEFFPQSSNEIRKIEKLIKTYTKMAHILNKVANPFFKNILKDWSYLFKELLPWLPSFLYVLLKTSLFNKSLEVVLESICSNQSLNDMVSQHFFKGTPANFAFGYFENFLDYKYPLGGTAELPNSLAKKILDGGGVIQMNTEIKKIDPHKKVVFDQLGKEYSYDLLLWSADIKSLYKQIILDKSSLKLQKSIKKERDIYLSAKTGESVFSIFLAVDESPDVFRKISKGHFIYTPKLKGLGEIHRKELETIKADFARISKKELFQWLKDFCIYNSYEISIPVLKDKTLAPENKTGLIISILFDGELYKMVELKGWYDEFKNKTMEYMLDSLEKSIYPHLREKIIFKSAASPITLMNLFNTSNGAITGWNLEEKSPVPNNLFAIMGTTKTNIPCVFKSGQWSYSPSGIPIAILTGRLAARNLVKKSRHLQ